MLKTIVCGVCILSACQNAPSPSQSNENIHSTIWKFSEWRKHKKSWDYNVWFRFQETASDKNFNDSILFFNEQQGYFKPHLAGYCSGQEDSTFYLGRIPYRYIFFVECLTMYSINTRAPFIWFGLDWLEEFYVRHSYKGSELGAPLTNQHFYISKIYKDTAFFKSWNAQPNSPSPEYDQHTKRYIEARNGIGHVFDISHYRQFYWLNNLLRNEPLYHGTKNLYKIDSLIRFLHTTFETNKQMIARYSQEGKTSVWLANCTKGNLLGYDFLAPIYPDWDFCPLQYSDGQIDSFLLLKKHLQTFTIPPTLLYFKKNSVCGAYNWYNYALAIWLEYVDDIPQVTGAQIITPRRVYFYNCPHSLGYAQTGENSF